MASGPPRTDGRGAFLAVGLLWGLILGVVSYFASGEVAYLIQGPVKQAQRGGRGAAAASPGEQAARGKMGRFENQDKPEPVDEGTEAIFAFVILLVAGASIGALLPSGPRGSFLLGGLAIAAPGIVLSVMILAMTAAFPS